MWSCPAEVEDALWEAVRVVVGPSALAPARLREAVVERSRLYTSRRESIHEPRDRDCDLAARAVFYSVADAAKIMVPVAELRGRGLIAERPKVLDLGAGCGAMSWGLRAAGVELSSIEAIDSDRRALEIMSSVARQLGVDVEPHVRDLSRGLSPSSFDLAIAGTLVNELDDPLPLVRSVLGSLRDGGSLILIEPALRDTARRLHRLRDELLSANAATVFAPCIRSSAPCPALEDERDWCHEDRSTSLPPRAQRLAEETGLRRHGLKFAYLVLRRDGATLVDDTVAAARVVSRVRKLKGRWEGFVCSDDGRQRISLLKRHVGAHNRAFTQLQRGDVVIGAGTARLEADAALERVRPAETD